MLIVYPSKREFQVTIAHKEEVLEFTFIQLDYKTKSLIHASTTSMQHGELVIDSNLQVFLTLKYALKAVKGLFNSGGNAYELSFEKGDNNALTDDCLDDILATPLSDNLVYTGSQLLNGIPKNIVNPLTGAPIEDIKIVDSKGGQLKNGLTPTE